MSDFNIERSRGLLWAHQGFAIGRWAASAGRLFVRSVPLLAIPAIAGCVVLDRLDQNTFQDCADCPEMVSIAGGTFDMGQTIDREYGEELNGPRHSVTIEKSFAVARHEVTVGQFRKFVEATGHVSEGHCNIYEPGTSWFLAPDRSWQNPGYDQADDHPVVCVSWEDTQAYANWLSGQTGKSYRLTSEAEWEFLSATGGMGAGTTGEAITHEVANIGAPECCGPDTGGPDIWMETAPVASFAADGHGIFDLHGNVFEWQADCYNNDYRGAPVDGSARISACSHPDWRAVRGGSWGDSGEFLATTFRLRGDADESYFTLGFRVARSLD